MNRFTRRSLLLSLVALLFTAGAAHHPVGGFEVRPEHATTEGAALMVYMYGCDKPHEAKVVGHAEGLVAGKRVSVPLTLRTRTEGLYDVMWDRPAGEGKWVLTFTASYLGHFSSVIVPMDDAGRAILPEADRYGRRFEPIRRTLTPADVTQALG